MFHELLRSEQVGGGLAAGHPEFNATGIVMVAGRRTPAARRPIPACRVHPPRLPRRSDDGTAASEGRARVEIANLFRGAAARRSGVVLVLLAIGLCLVAPIATPIGFDPAYGVNTISAMRDISPANRDLQYLLLLLASVLLPTGIYLILKDRRPGAPDCPRWLIAIAPATAVAALCGLFFLLSLSSLASGLGIGLYPLHEGEWLGYAFGDPFPILHGYAINVAPTRVCRAAGFGAELIGCGRVYRIVLGAIAYAMIPATFYAAFRFRRAPMPSAWLTGLSCLLFALLEGALYRFSSDQWLDLFVAPVRAVPFLAMMIGAMIAARAIRIDRAGSGVAGFALYGALIPVAFVGNILSVWFGAAILVLLIVACAAVDHWRARRWLAPRYLGAALAGAALSALVLTAIAPEVMTVSWNSLSYFSATGRSNFADEIPWFAGGRMVLLLRFGELPIYFGVAGLAAFVVLAALFSKGGLYRLAWRHLPSLLLAGFAFLTLVMHTGFATSAQGLALAVPFLLVSHANILRWRPPTGGRPTAVAVGAAAVLFLLAGFAVQLVSASYFALGSIRAALTTPDTEQPGHQEAGRLRRLLDSANQSCVFSLISDGSFILDSHRPACVTVRSPIYGSRLDEQARMVAELSERDPAYVHVASDFVDHPYAPQMHVASVWRHVVANYAPAAVLDGRWLWRRRQGGLAALEVVSRPAELRTIERNRAGIKVAIALADAPDRQLEWGALLRCSDGRLCGATVSNISDGEIVLNFVPDPRAMDDSVELLLWRDSADGFVNLGEVP